jgi:hypothetical protein
MIKGLSAQRTYIGKEDSRDATARMLSLLVAFSRVVASQQTSLVAGYRVLMRLHAAIEGITQAAQPYIRVFGPVVASVLLRVEWKICSRHHLDEIHEVVVRVITGLPGVFEWVYVVVSPGVGPQMLAANAFRKLRAKPKLVDLVLEGVLDRAFPVVLKVMNVHVTIAEGPTRREVEIADNFVDADRASDSAALVSLLLKFLRIVFTLALLDFLA